MHEPWQESHHSVIWELIQEHCHGPARDDAGRALIFFTGSVKPLDVMCTADVLLKV